MQDRSSKKGGIGWERRDGRYSETGEARQAWQGIRYLKYKQVLVEHLKYMSLDVLDHAFVDALLMRFTSKLAYYFIFQSVSRFF